nr:hypothetical protein [Tanacetum cinerariifolium]
MDTEEAVNEGRQSIVDTARPDVSTARPHDNTARQDVSTARQELSTAGPTTTPTTSTIFDDEEMTLVDTLIKLKDEKAKGVAFKDSDSTHRPARSILTLKPLPKINPKDKGKGVLEEHESVKKMTKSDFDVAQIAKDEEIARQWEVELQAGVEKERQREEQASIDYIANLYDEVQELIADFAPIGSEEDERIIRDMNKKSEEESSDKGFDRLDLMELYNMVMQRFESTTPKGVDLVLWEEISTYHKNTRKDVVFRLIVESASDAAYDIIGFIQK